MQPRRAAHLVLAIATAFSTAPATLSGQSATVAATAPASLPTKIADGEYWKLINDLGEPGGYFRIPDNFTSNEMEVGWIFTRLQDQKVNGGVYLGVGPEQNLSYIASIRPKMAVLFDIRRQAMVQHQMFKAMFELAPDRADFLSILFAKPRPAKLDSTTSIQPMWDAFWYVPTDTALARRNWDRVREQLVKIHGFTFTDYELQMMKNVYDAFIAYGPVITTNGGQTGGRQPANTFADMTGYSPDAAGIPRSFMSSEDNYRYLRALHQNNLILTVTGDFGGPKAIRAVADYLKARSAVVSAFYVSNVEQYLFMDGKQGQFYANVATLPIDDRSVFIRPYSMRNFQRDGGSGTTNSLCPIGGFLRAVNAGRVYSNNDALACPVM
ncbi:MAG: hypothetical protein ABIR92_12105 [Gemmatimonadaceae bacterium]